MSHRPSSVFLDLLSEPTGHGHQRSQGAGEQRAAACGTHSRLPAHLPDDDDLPAAAVLPWLPSGLLHLPRTGGFTLPIVVTSAG